MRTKVFFIQLMFSFLLVLNGAFIFAQNSFYWETPRALSSVDSRFPAAVSDGNHAAIFFEEIGKNQIWINCIARSRNKIWSSPRRIAGPFSYSGDVPDIISAAISSDGTIALAVLMNSHSVGVYVSHDGGESFSLSEPPRQSLPVVGPRIFCTADGGFMLFAALGENENISILSAYSKNGDTWTELSAFEPSKNLENPFAPYLIASGGRDVVVFQVQYNTGTRLSYQLYSSFREQGGSWSVPVMVTDQRSLPVSTSNAYTNYHNQRPVLSVFEGTTYLAWERTYYTSESARIWVAELDENGMVSGTSEELTSDGNAHRPQFFSYGGTISVVWFDNRRGADSVYMAQKNGFLWEETQIASSKEGATFAYPLLLDGGGELAFVWQQLVSKKNARIYLLESDHTVSEPKIIARNFTSGKRSSSERVTARVQLPADSSGIAGYSWLWTDDTSAEPPEEFMRLPKETDLSGNADHDGEWYFKVRAIDYAGNWSKSASITFYRDTTPPLAPIIQPSQTDQFGFLTSNSFSMQWIPHPDETDDVAGYSWVLSYVAPFDKAITYTKRHPITLSDGEVERRLETMLAKYDGIEKRAVLPPRRNQGNVTKANYKNRANGLYTFSVCAIDSVGNVGPATAVTVLLNKYIPSTYIVSANAKADTFGAVDLTLLGGGFTYDGTIKTVHIDKDGKPPYDRTFSAGEFKVRSDERITGIHFDGLDAGTYKIGLVHPDRGLYFSGAILSVSDYGTVKIETPYAFIPDWKPETKTKRYHVQTGTVLIWILFALALLGFFAALRGMMVTAREVVTVRHEVRALLTGGSMPQENQKRAEAAVRRSGSLKYKLVGFTTVLVLMIVAMVALPLGYVMTRTQERTLAEGLEERVQVLMEGIASGVKAYLPAQNVLELSYLPSQADAFPEASYATIIGFPADDSNVNLDFVWATNDNAIETKIDTEQLNVGASRLTDETVRQITERCHGLQEDVFAQVGEIASHITVLNAEGARLGSQIASRSGRTNQTSTAQIQQRLSEINDESRLYTVKLNDTLTELSRKASDAFPDYDIEKLDRDNTDYLFYKPVMFRQGSDQHYVRAIVLLQVSTKNLIQTVDSAARTIIIIAGIIALAAILLGLIGSLVMASIFIRPIRRLVSHVEMISETQDKEKLAGKEIRITSRDEIGFLGETVNEMTRSLVKAAQDEHLLMDGQVVQRTFLPLSSTANGAKETTSALIDKHVRFFGYYEGASGVSGDYFDYKKLDDRWYVIIKSDASGHGVPAALIMTVVATIFRRYFEQWSFKVNGTSLNKVVVQINDFIESLGLKGKFATLMICLFDTQTGDIYMCNAGDNIIHYYDISEHSQKLVSLAQTPAAGPLPSFMVDMKGGFKVEKLHLDKGDVLFLYTDGIEESTRKFRDSNFSVIKCTDGADGAGHGNHKTGEESEQLTPERIDQIVEAVFAKKIYRLQKYHNPLGDEELIFDFTTCEGTVDDAILALISVEKVFRFYKDPAATETDEVRVDRKIDSFLKAHFSRYDFYCASQRDDGDLNYVYYTNLKEDEQLDDLTLIAVRNLG